MKYLDQMEEIGEIGLGVNNWRPVNSEKYKWWLWRKKHGTLIDRTPNSEDDYFGPHH